MLKLRTQLDPIDPAALGAAETTAYASSGACWAGRVMTSTGVSRFWQGSWAHRSLQDCWASLHMRRLRRAGARSLQRGFWSVSAPAMPAAAPVATAYVVSPEGPCARAS